jgi:hypothetical protein
MMKTEETATKNPEAEAPSAQPAWSALASAVRAAQDALERDYGLCPMDGSDPACEHGQRAANALAEAAEHLSKLAGERPPRQGVPSPLEPDEDDEEPEPETEGEEPESEESDDTETP